MSAVGSILAMSIGGGELFFVLLVILLFFGSKNIPDMARSFGKGIREVRHATEQVKREIRDSVPLEDEKLEQAREELNEARKIMEQAEGTVKRTMNS